MKISLINSEEDRNKHQKRTFSILKFRIWLKIVQFRPVKLQTFSQVSLSSNWLREVETKSLL